MTGLAKALTRAEGSFADPGQDLEIVGMKLRIPSARDAEALDLHLFTGDRDSADVAALAVADICRFLFSGDLPVLLVVVTMSAVLDLLRSGHERFTEGAGRETVAARTVEQSTIHLGSQVLVVRKGHYVRSQGLHLDGSGLHLRTVAVAANLLAKDLIAQVELLDLQ